MLLTLALLSSSEAGDALRDDSLRVMSYNIRYANPGDGQDAWQHRHAAVSSMLEETAADIFGLQEALLGQIEDLAPNLKNYAWYGVGRDDGRQRGEFVPIFFRQDRFERKESGTFWLSDKPDTPGSRGWDAALPRTVSWLILKDKQTGISLLAANTHFDHRGTKARAASARLIRTRLAEIAAGRPVLLTGDFNCLNNSEPYRVLTQPAAAPEGAAPLHDARVRTAQPPVGPNSTWNGFQQVVPDRIIDFVFVSHTIKVAGYAVLDPRRDKRFLSDHLPVLVELDLNKNK